MGTVNTSIRYYYAGTQRIAMRVGNSQDITGLFWITSDHLGSTTVTSDNNGNKYGELRYKAWGENRYTWGSTPTTYRYAGQRQESSFGLYFYNSRWYDKALGRFVQADSIIPEAQQGVQAWDRYAYVNNNPVLYNDPNGNCLLCMVIISAYYFIESIAQPQNEATQQAWEIVGDWFFETGEDTIQEFGPENALTKEVMTDPAIDEFKEQWKESNYQDNFSWEHERDEREEGPLVIRIVNGTIVFVQEHVVELGQSTLGYYGSEDPSMSIDAVGGTIGSLDFITVENVGSKGFNYKVINVMGWRSATRIPGTNWFVIDNKKREQWGPGGTIVQIFYWYEPKPIDILEDNR